MQVTDRVAAMHRSGIVHRDLHRGCIMLLDQSLVDPLALSNSRELCITDFGHAATAGVLFTAALQCFYIYTPFSRYIVWIAPENIRFCHRRVQRTMDTTNLRDGHHPDEVK